MVLWAKGMSAGTESSTEVRHRLLADWFLYYGLPSAEKLHKEQRVSEA